MICQVTNRPCITERLCMTNGCGNKYYKLHTLDSNYKVHKKYDPQPKGFNKLKQVKITR